MKSNIQEVKTINVRLISDKPVRKTPYQVKGVIMKEHPDSDITPMLNGNYREKFLYPRVQVKILNEEIYLIGIAEGVDPIKSILPKLSTLNFGNITFEITDTEVDEIKNCFRKNSKSIKYQFISPWFALNQNNGKKYRSLKNKDRINYLNKLLQQNIIFISKEMDVEIDKNISTKLNLSSLSPQSMNEYSWGGFIGEFSVNLLLPNFLGIGNGVTRGYGTIFGSLNKGKISFDQNKIKNIHSDFSKKGNDEKFSKPKSKKQIKSKRIFSEEFDIEVDDMPSNRNGNLPTNKDHKRRWKKKKISKKSPSEINYNSEEYHKKQHKF